MNAFVRGIVDGNAKKQGKIITLGERLYLVRDKEAISPEDTVVITVDRYYDEIRDGLIRNGVSPDKIIGIKDFIQHLAWGGHYKYDLAVTAVVRNVADIIQEWIEYHRIVGVDHFYIYDDNSTDDMEKIICKYIQKGIVTYRKWGVVRKIRIMMPS